jgi:hypothetical protein
MIWERVGKTSYLLESARLRPNLKGLGMNHVWAAVLELLLSGDNRWAVLAAVIGLLCLWAAIRTCMRAKKFKLVIEYIASDK